MKERANKQTNKQMLVTFRVISKPLKATIKLNCTDWPKSQLTANMLLI
jgi:hypothetical protein